MVFVVPVLCLLQPAPAGAPLSSPQAQSAAHRPDMVERVNRALDLRPDQIKPVDDLVRSHEEKIRAILADSSIGKSEKALEVRDRLRAMILELTPLLTPSQVDDLNDLFESELRPGPHAKIAVEFSDFMPISSETRSIFGRSLTAFGVGFGGDGKIGRRSRFEFGVDLFEMPSYANRLFVLSPQATYEYRVPFRTRLYAFAVASAGPSYMDYSYDLPNGEHFAAKNAGLDGSLELGLQWGPLRLGAEYRAFTQPSGLNFDGIELTASLTVLRF